MFEKLASRIDPVFFHEDVLKDLNCGEGGGVSYLLHFNRRLALIDLGPNSQRWVSGNPGLTPGPVFTKIHPGYLQVCIP